MHVYDAASENEICLLIAIAPDISKPASEKPGRRQPMTRTEIEFSELAERVRILERQNLCWKLASFFLLFIVASSLAAGLAAQVRNEPPLMRARAVQAQSFLLEDADGTIRGQMSMNGAGPNFEVYDQTGKVIWSVPSKAKPVPTR
jgi:hypothetical protein